MIFNTFKSLSCSFLTIQQYTCLLQDIGFTVCTNISINKIHCNEEMDGLHSN